MNRVGIDAWMALQSCKNPCTTRPLAILTGSASADMHHKIWVTRGHACSTFI